MIARKFVEKKVEGEYELIRNHVIDVIEQIAINEIVERFELYDADETTYLEFGICFDWDGNVSSICVDRFISGVTALLDTQEEEEYWDLEKEKVDEFRAELKKLERYRGYDLYI